MPSGGKLIALLIAQLCLCGAWGFGAWYYFHKQPLDECKAAETTLRKQIDLQAARADLMEAAVWVQRGQYNAALDCVPRARLRARQAGTLVIQDIDELEQLLRGRDARSRERIVVVASRLAPADERTCTALARTPVAVWATSEVSSSTAGAAERVREPAPKEAVASIRETVAKVSVRDTAEEPAAPTRRRKRTPGRKRVATEGAKAGTAKGPRTYKTAKSSGSSRKKTRGTAVLVGAGATVAAQPVGDSTQIAASRALVTEALLKRQAEVKGCVAPHAAAGGKAGVNVRVTVSGQGAVTNKRIDLSGIEGSVADVRACVERIIMAIHFPVVALSEVQIAQSWSWTMSGSAQASSAAEARSEGRSEVRAEGKTEGRSEVSTGSAAQARSMMTEALLKRQADIRACVVGQAPPGAKVNVTIRLTISGQGQVTSKKIEPSLGGPEGDSSSEAVRSCVEGVVGSISFPSATGVSEVRLVQTWAWKTRG